MRKIATGNNLKIRLFGIGERIMKIAPNAIMAFAP